MELGCWIRDGGGVEGRLELGEAEPFFIESRVARIVDSPKIKNIAVTALRLSEGGPSEESGGKELVALLSGKGSVVGGDRVVVEGEERACQLGLMIGEVEVAVILEGI